MGVLCIVLTVQGCSCKEDRYGDHLGLEVPVRSYPASTQFQVGDTLFWEGDFSKFVDVRGHQEPILLENFNFFTGFDLSEISSVDTIDFNKEIRLVPIVGDIVLGDFTQNLYPIQFLETEDSYRFHFGIVLLEPGLYTANFFVFVTQFERSDHPATFECNNDPRTTVNVFYQNESTKREVYDSLYLSSPNPDIQRLTTFERYRDLGSVTFRVLP
jgi:hypothetical protein